MTTPDIVFKIVMPITFIASCGYLIWMVMQIRHPSQDQPPGKEPEEPQKGGDIMGKSKFDLRHSLPQAATNAETVSSEQKSDIFASNEGQEYKKVIPIEDLDDVFNEDTQCKYEIIDAYVPLEYDGDEPQNEDPDGDEDEEEYEALNFVKTPKAQGVRFEDMGEAFRAVVLNVELTPVEKVEAGKTLHGLKNTAVMEAVIANNKQRQDTVSTLIDSYLTMFNNQKIKEQAYAPQSNVPDDFDVRDYA